MTATSAAAEVEGEVGPLVSLPLTDALRFLGSGWSLTLRSTVGPPVMVGRPSGFCHVLAPSTMAASTM